jgi:hypothetical protein
MGCLKGVQEVIEQISFIDMRSNEMHIKIIHKHDTADWKPDALKISSLYLSAQVEWNE